MERLSDIFSLNPSPLLFTQMHFWVFFILIYSIYAAIYNRRMLRNSYLFLVSIFFYYKISGLFFIILLYTTVFDYFLGQAIYKTNHKSRKRWLLFFSVTSNMLVLSFFKYAYFFTDSFNEIFHTKYEFINQFVCWEKGFWPEDGECFSTEKLIAPVGISFYTFQSISYAVDIYRGLLKPVKSFIDFAFFVSFFPQLLSGPIVRAIDFIPQIYKPYDITKKDFSKAVFMIIKGLIKKLVVADFVAINLIDPVLKDPLHYTGFENLSAMWGYSMQIYCDFSGYTDIAIGLALLMGFRLNLNFNSPYKAANVADFWRRWHISLSTWLRDYLYIPLGGNRGGSLGSYVSISIILIFLTALTHWYFLIPVFIVISVCLWSLSYYYPKVKTYINRDINLLITMILGGLWHGPSLGFVKWGILNGVALVIYKYWKNVSPYEKSKHWLIHFWKVLFTFNFITFTRIFFRVQDDTKAQEVMNQIFGNLDPQFILPVIAHYAVVFIILLVAFIIHWLPVRVKDQIETTYIEMPVPAQVVVTALMGMLIYQSVTSEAIPFIYFQF